MPHSLALETVCKALFENHANITNYTVEELILLQSTIATSKELGKELLLALGEVIGVQLAMLADQPFDTLYKMFETERSFYKSFRTAFIQELTTNPRLMDLRGCAAEQRFTGSENIHFFGPVILFKNSGVVNRYNPSCCILFPVLQDQEQVYSFTIEEGELEIQGTTVCIGLSLRRPPSMGKYGGSTKLEAARRATLEKIKSDDSNPIRRDSYLYYTLRSEDCRTIVVQVSEKNEEIINIFASLSHEMPDLPEDLVLQKAYPEWEDGLDYFKKFMKSGVFTFVSVNTGTTYTVNYTFQMGGYHVYETVDSMTEAPIDSNYRINDRLIRSEADIDESLWPRPIADIEQLMKTPSHTYSSVRFMGIQDSLLAVEKEDYKKLQQYGLTNRQLASFLQYFESFFNTSNQDKNFIFLGKKYGIVNASFYIPPSEMDGLPISWQRYAGRVYSPFDDTAIPSVDLVIFDHDKRWIDQDGHSRMPKVPEQRFGFSSALIPFIDQHGFFERGPYRFNIDAFIEYFIKPSHIPSKVVLEEHSSLDLAMATSPNQDLQQAQESPIATLEIKEALHLDEDLQVLQTETDHFPDLPSSDSEHLRENIPAPSGHTASASLFLNILGGFAVSVGILALVAALLFTFGVFPAALAVVGGVAGLYVGGGTLVGVGGVLLGICFFGNPSLDAVQDNPNYRNEVCS